jgi:hypothetical protein
MRQCGLPATTPGAAPCVRRGAWPTRRGAFGRADASCASRVCASRVSAQTVPSCVLLFWPFAFPSLSCFRMPAIFSARSESTINEPVMVKANRKLRVKVRCDPRAWKIAPGAGSTARREARCSGEVRRSAQRSMRMAGRGADRWAWRARARAPRAPSGPFRRGARDQRSPELIAARKRASKVCWIG